MDERSPKSLTGFSALGRSTATELADWCDKLRTLFGLAQVNFNLSGQSIYQHSGQTEDLCPHIETCLEQIRSDRSMFGLIFPGDGLNPDRATPVDVERACVPEVLHEQVFREGSVAFYDLEAEETGRHTVGSGKKSLLLSSQPCVHASAYADRGH